MVRTAHILLFVLPLLAACRITDHSERADDEVDANDLRFPASGYEKADPAAMARIVFEQPSHSFGRVVQGAKVDHTYRFTNQGKVDLIITDVRASCGCTVSKAWPRHPIRPGQSGEIEVTFDSEGRDGRQEKTITVVANTSPSTTGLFLHGEVVAPGSGDASENNDR